MSRWLSWDGAFKALLIALTGAYIWLATTVHVFLASDPITHYVPAVQGLLSGRGIAAFAGDTYRGPFLPALAAAIAIPLGGDVFAAGLVVGVISYALATLAVFLVVRESFGAPLAFTVAAGVAVTGTVLLTGLSWLSDMPFAALCLWSLWLMYRAEPHFYLPTLLAGICAGLAFDTRWNGLFLPIVAIGAVLVNPWRFGPRRRLGWLAVFGAGFMLAAGPWLYINYVLHGSAFYTGVNNSDWNPVLLAPGVHNNIAVKELLWANPGFFFSRYVQRLLWSGPLEVAQLVPLPVLLLAPAGALILLRRLDRRRALLLIFSGVFWGIASLTMFEARFYILLLPLLILLPMFFWQSESVPDRQFGRRRFSAKFALLLIGLAALGLNQYGASAARIASVNSNLQAQLEAAKLLSAQQPLAHNATRVAVRFFSGSRYFIPSIAGVPADFLSPSGAYLSPPVQFSHVFVEEGIPALNASDVPASIFDPKGVGPQLEAIYYKPAPLRAVLYRVLRDNQVWPIKAITVSAALDGAHGPPAVMDGDSQTGWLTPPAATPDAPATLTVDLGRSITINRVWLLPPPDPNFFPEAYRIESSADGAAWTLIQHVERDALNERQNPRAFAFENTTSRYVRFTALRLRRGPAGQYQAGINAIRVGLVQAVDAGGVRFSMTRLSLNYDPARSELEVPVRNVGLVTSRVLVQLAVGTRPTFVMMSPPVAAGQVVTFSVALSPLVMPGIYAVTAVIDPRYADPATAVSHAMVVVGELNSLGELPVPNLISNPAFEDGTRGWDLKTATHLDSGGHAGSPSLHVDKSDFAGTSFYHVSTQAVALQANVLYVFGAWLKISEVQESARLILQSGDSGPFWDQARPPAVDDSIYSGTHDWTLRVGFIPIQAMPAPGRITLLMSNFLHGSVWLADAFLIPVYTTRLGN